MKSIPELLVQAESIWRELTEMTSERAARFPRDVFKQDARETECLSRHEEIIKQIVLGAEQLQRVARGAVLVQRRLEEVDGADLVDPVKLDLEERGVRLRSRYQELCLRSAPRELPLGDDGSEAELREAV